MVMRCCYVSALVVLMVGPFGSRAEPPDPTKCNFLVFPAKKREELTELQSAIGYGGKDAPNYRVIINGSAVLREDKSLDPKAIDWEGLKKEIHETVRLRIGGQKYRIAIDVAYYGRQPNEEARRMLRWALMGMAKDFGFDEIDVSTSISISTDAEGWANDIKLKKAYDLIGKKQEKEPAAGNELVTVYPVRNPYSRLVLGGADCVVEIKTPFDKGDDGTLTKAQELVIMETIDSLKLSSKGIIYFRIKKKFGAAGAVRKFCDETGKKLAEKVGFKSHVTHIEEVAD